MNFSSRFVSAGTLVACLLGLVSCEEKPQPPSGPISVLLLDGQNDHAWRDTTPVLASILENSGRFEVIVSTSPPAAPSAPRKPKAATSAAREKYSSDRKVWEAAMKEHEARVGPQWEVWRPDFASFDVVVSNYNGELWPEPVRQAFEEYVAGGGGFVAVHAANNAFPEWPAYHEMLGVGAWDGRDEGSGSYLRKRENGWVQEVSKGAGGSNGKRHEFVVVTQIEHPIMDGLPEKWLHAEDELYDRLRGPAKNVTVLAAAFSQVNRGGSGEWEPVLLAIPFGEGRVFQTTLGDGAVSMSDVGFAETLKRGTEWAATGFVTFAPPAEGEMTTEQVVLREEIRESSDAQ